MQWEWGWGISSEGKRLVKGVDAVTEFWHPAFLGLGEAEKYREFEEGIMVEEREWRRLVVRDPGDAGRIEEGAGLRPVDLDMRNAVGYRLVKGFNLLR